MPQTVDVIGYGLHEFPDEMSQEDIEKVLTEQFPSPEAKQKALKTGVNAALGITQGLLDTLGNPAAAEASQMGAEQGRLERQTRASDAEDIQANLSYGHTEPQGEASTIYGGPPLQTGGGPIMMPSLQVTPQFKLGEEAPAEEVMNEPILGLPNAPNVEDVPPKPWEHLMASSTALGQVFGPDVSASVVREAYNQAKALPEFFTSPAGLASIPAMAAAPLATTAYFTYDTMKGLSQHLEDSIANWGSMSPPEKARAIVKTVGLGTLFGFLARGTAGLAASRIAGNPAPQGRDIASTMFPWSKPPMLEQSLVEPSARPTVPAPVFDRPEFQHPPLPKAEGPRKGRGPYRNIEGVLYDADGNIVDPQGNIRVPREQPTSAAPPEPKGVPLKAKQDPEDLVAQSEQALPKAAEEAKKDLTEKGEQDAVQEQSADESLLRNQGIRREGGLPGVGAQDVEPQGAAKPSAAAGTYEEIERAALDEPQGQAVEAADQLGGKAYFTDDSLAPAKPKLPNPEDEPFAAIEDRTVARTTKDGRIAINRQQFNEWLADIPENRRAVAIESLIAEEHIHTKTRPHDALNYWRNLSGFEQALVKRRYTGKWKGDPRFSDTLMGHEALRGRIQQLAHMTPREVAEASGRERWTVKGIYALEAAIQNIRRAMGTEASATQLAILQHVRANLAVAKSAVLAQPQEQPQAFNKNRILKEERERFWSSRGFKIEDILRTMTDSIQKDYPGWTMKDLRARLSTLRNENWPRVLPRRNAEILKQYWAEHPEERIKDAEVSLRKMRNQLERDRNKADAGKAGSPTDEDIANDRQELTLSENFINELKSNAQDFFPEVFNKKRKKAAEDTMPLGLSFGKWTEEKGFQKDLTAKPSGEQVGIKPGAYYAEQVHNEAVKFINGPITVTEKARTSKTKEDEFGQPEVRTVPEVERPNLREFEKWAKTNHPAVTQGQLYEMWKSIIWDHLIPASSERLADWVKALNLQRKLEGRKTPKGDAKAEPREIPEYTPEGDIVKQVTGPAKPMTTEMGLEIPMKDALAPITRAKRIDDLRREAKMWEDHALTAPPAKPVAQSDMFAELELRRPNIKSKSIFEKTPTNAKDMLELARALRDRADAMEHVSDIGGKEKSKAEYQRPRDYRTKVITEIALKLFKEAEPKDQMLSPKDVFAKDIHWDNPNTEVSPWREIRPKEVEDPVLLEKLLTDEARRSGEPVSWTRRMVGLVNDKTGEVVLSTVFKDGRKGLKVMEPTGNGYNVVLDSIKKRWRPFVSILWPDAFKDFRKGFREMRDFNEYIGDEARQQKTKEYEELKGQAPDEIAAQAFADEEARNQQEEANAEALLAEERVDPKELEAATAARFGEGGETVPETQVTEGEGGTFQGPHADIVRDIAEGETRRNAPITSGEALSVLELMASDRKKYKVDNMTEVHKALDNLADRAKNGELKPRHWMAINALRKAARSIFEREQERIRLEKTSSKLAEAKKALGVEEPEPEFTLEDAYRMALTEFYEIVRDTETDAQFLTQAMGRFAREIGDTGTPAGRATSPTAKELQLKRTVLTPDVMGGLPKEVEVPVPSRNPWSKYGHKVEPMPLGSVRGLAEGLTKQDLPDLKWLDQNAMTQYDPTQGRDPNAELEKRNITLSEYDSGNRTDVKATHLTPEERALRTEWMKKNPQAAGAAITEGDRFIRGKSEKITQAGEVAKRQRGDQITEADLSSPESFRKKKEELSSLISDSRELLRKLWASIRGGDIDTGNMGGMAQESAKLQDTLGKAIRDARARHVIKDKLYYTLDALDNAASMYALRSGNAIKLASMDVIPSEGKLKRIGTMWENFRRNQELGEKRRRAAKAIIAATVQIKRDGNVVVDAQGNPILRIVPKRFTAFKLLTESAINSAQEMIRKGNLKERIVGRKWKQAATEMKAEVEYAESEYLEAMAGKKAEQLKYDEAYLKSSGRSQAEERAFEKSKDPKDVAEREARDNARKRIGDSVWENHPLNETVKEFRKAMAENLKFMNENGILVKSRENYVPGRYEGEVFTDGMINFGEQKILGLKPRMPKAFDSYYHAIASKKGPYIPINGDVADLAQSSILASHRMINRSTWEMTAQGLRDPKTNKLIIRKPKQIKVDRIVKDPETDLPTTIQIVDYASPHADYQLVYPNNDTRLVPVAALHEYASMMKAAIAPSLLRDNLYAQTGSMIASALKHGVVLVLDSFHPLRLAQYAWAGSGDVPGKKGFLDPRPKFGFMGGYTALNFRPEDIAKAVDSGWITKDAAEWANKSVKVNVTELGPGTTGWTKRTVQKKMTYRDIGEKFTKKWGLNAVKINDVMYRDAVRSIPMIGKMWHSNLIAPVGGLIFDKVTTGLMLDGAVRAFVRMNAEHPDMDMDKLGRYVAKDMNVIYGNMGRQGIFRNQTAREVATTLLLAPMWREGLIQKDARFIGRAAEWAGRAPGFVGSRAAKLMRLGYKDREWQDMPKMNEMGPLGRTYLRGLLTYFVLAQTINMLSRQQPTWKNPEEGHQWDAWLPIGDSGVWLSTFGVFGEVTHQMLSMIDKMPTVVEAGLQMGANMLGPMGRFGMALGTGKDPEGNKATSSWQWVKNAVGELMPAPITAAAPLKMAGNKLFPASVEPPRPGEIPQRLLGLGGVKAQLPTKYQNQVLDLVNKWKEDQNIPPEAINMGATDEPSYTKLRRAIWMDNPGGARAIYQGLMQDYIAHHPGQGRADAIDHIRATMELHTTRAWTGNEDLESHFSKWVHLNHPEKREILFRAQVERSREFSKFLRMVPQLKARE